MVTQLILSKRVIATEEMKQVAKDEQVDFNFILKNVTNGLSQFQKIWQEKQHIKPTGIKKGLKSKINVNIGTSTLLSIQRDTM
jgi:phosphomethylpyrimidine synthase